MEANEAYAELSEDLIRIEVRFRYNEQWVHDIKEIQGRQWNKEARFWSVPMDLISARALRDVFGPALKLGPALRTWAKEQVKYERNLRQLNAASDAKLEHTPKIIMDVIAGLPFEHPSVPPHHALRGKRNPRPYQRADIKLMSLSNAINGNDVGTGKTIEAIGAIYEAELFPKPVLFVAPKRTLTKVWKTEFERFSGYTVWTSQSPTDRQSAVYDITTLEQTDSLGTTANPIAIGLIADDLRLEKYYDVKLKSPPDDSDPLHACRDYRGNWYRYKSELQRDLFRINFGALIIDEFHMTGLPNRLSLFHLGSQRIKAERKWLMSATPIGGKARRLWPALNFLYPREYSSEWNWCYQWLHITEEEIYIKGGRGQKRTVKNVGGIKPGGEEEFFEHHQKHMTRRVKKDALPGIPDALDILVECDMEGKQLSNYMEFDLEHEVKIDGGRVSGGIVLTQYLRLRQMANSRLKIVRDKPVAMAESCKFEPLLEALEENGITKSDWEPGARAYIGVLDKSFLSAVMKVLQKAGIDCGRLDGDTKEDDADEMIDRFNDGTSKPFVIAMTIQTGGTGINLESAGSAHALDEDWDPDKMHQFFGRGDRGERTTPLKCYTYRTKNSIQEYVADVAFGKKITNRNVLDFASEIEARRQALKAQVGEA